MTPRSSHTPAEHARSPFHLILMFVLLLPLAAIPGCYRKVVRAEGIGTEQIDTQEGNRSNNAIDRFFYGEEERRKN